MTRPSQIDRVDSPPLSELTAYWDGIARIRHSQIEGGEDISLTEVLIPHVLSQIEVPTRAIVDLGCGSGRLTELLGGFAHSVVGVDASHESLSLARSASRHAAVRYVDSSIEDFGRTAFDADIAILNMVLMDTPKLDAVLRACRALLRPDGQMIATITHPWFWPRYWGYDREPWFHYRQETAIKAEFTISSGPTGHSTIHFHRSLERYSTALTDSGFEKVRFSEPWPTPESHARYPEPWEYPRFLSISARAS